MREEAWAVIDGMSLVSPWRKYRSRQIAEQPSQNKHRFGGQWRIVAEARDEIGPRWLFVDGSGNSFPWDSKQIPDDSSRVSFLDIGSYSKCILQSMNSRLTRDRLYLQQIADE